MCTNIYKISISYVTGCSLAWWKAAVRGAERNHAPNSAESPDQQVQRFLSVQ